MKQSQTFVRFFFFLFTLILVTGTLISTKEAFSVQTVILGLFIGALMGAFFLLLDFVFRKYHLLSFNTTLLGLFFGYLMGLALLTIFHTFLSFVPVVMQREIVSFVEMGLFLSALYLGVTMTLRASHELAFSLPFIKFSQAQIKTKEILVDHSALNDERLYDLAASGLMDGRIVVPRFLVKDFMEWEDSSDEQISAKAKMGQENLKKLETLPGLNLRYHDVDFPELKEPTQKILKLCRLLGANVLTSDLKYLVTSQQDEVRVINLNALATAFKPLMQRGEYLNIKIQRLGKEERQGIGYLEDGTMIVVNGGGNFIGKNIKACVLSVKQTQTGRMIFCNATEMALEHE